MGLTDDRRVPLDDFLPTLFAQIPGISSPLAKHWLLIALAEFCRKSHVWREVVAETEALDSELKLELLLPTGTAVAGFYSCIDSAGAEIAGINYEVISPQVIQFVPSFTEQSVTVLASLQATKNLRSVPETLYNRFCAEICAGAAADLVVMSGYEWSNPPMYQVHRRKFEQGISEAMRYAVNGYQTQAKNHRLERRQTYY